MGIAPSRQTPDATLADLGGEAVATLLEHAPFAVFVVDAGLRLLAMNRRAAPIFGRAPTGRSASAVSHAARSVGRGDEPRGSSCTQ